MARVLGPDSVSDHQTSPGPGVGQVLEARFELLELVGHGGMGAVYRARDLRTGNIVALKLLTIEEANGLRRFRREFRALSRLDHPNVVSVNDAYFGNRRPFFTMEFVPGSTLADWVTGAATDRPSPGARTERIRVALRQLFSGLSYIHAVGLVHRDLKPDNILVTPDDQLKIMDFGVVRSDASSGGITKGRIVGTLSYMAPEQLEGRPVDARSDLYSAGAVLYELLTGEVPFEEGPFGSLARAILNDAPPSPRSLNPAVDPQLASLAMTLLAKKAWQRFPSAEAALAVLEADGAWSPARSLRLLESQFVGSEGELSLAREMLEGIDRDGPRVLLVSGQPGLGKTRFLAEVAALARRPGRSMLSISPAIGEGTPFAGLRPLIAGIIADPAAAHLSPPELAAIESLLDPPGDVAGADDLRAAGLRAVGLGLAHLSASTPLVLLLDDLHNFEEQSLDLLLHLLREIAAPASPDDPPLRILLVGSFTDGAEVLQSRLGRVVDLTRRLRLGSCVVLTPYTSEESQAVIRSLLGEASIPPALSAWVHRETGGHPYFIQETIRHLVSEELIVRRLGCLTLGWAKIGRPPREELDERDFEGLPLARGVRELLGRQLARLGAEARGVLDVAAVIGSEFTFDTLLGGSLLHEDALLDVLQELLTRAILRELSDHRDTFRFAHDKTRDLLLDEIPEAVRRALHARVAAAIEEGPGILRDPVALARHHDAAGQTERALAYLPQAAGKLAARMAHREAADAWARYLELDPSDRVQADARFHRACQLNLAQRGWDALRAFEEVLAAATEPTRKGLVLRELAKLEGKLGDVGKAVTRACEFCALTRLHGDERDHAEALFLLGDVHLQHGHCAAAERNFAEAEEIFRRGGDIAKHARAMRMRGAALAGLGRLGEAAELLQAALGRARAAGAVQDERAAILELGTQHLAQGSLSKGIACYEQALAMALELGPRRQVAAAQNNLGYALTLAGDHAEAERCLARCLRYIADGSDAALEAAAHGNRAILRRHAGDLVGALEDLERARSAHAATVHPGFLVEVTLEGARIDTARGKHAAARRSVRSALAVARGNQLLWHEATARVELARALQGRPALAQAARARELGTDMGAELVVAQALARAAELHEELAEAESSRAARQAATGILRNIGRQLGPRERMFLRTELCRRVFEPIPT